MTRLRASSSWNATIPLRVSAALPASMWMSKCSVLSATHVKARASRSCKGRTSWARKGVQPQPDVAAARRAQRIIENAFSDISLYPPRKATARPGMPGTQSCYGPSHERAPRAAPLDSEPPAGAGNISTYDIRPDRHASFLLVDSDSFPGELDGRAPERPEVRVTYAAA